MNDSDHSGRSVLVTGGGSGIGRAAALDFAARGARVAVADIQLPAAERTVSEIERAGGEALAIEADIANEASVREMIAATVDRFGRLDAAFNNAGISDTQVAFIDMTLDAWNRMIEVNLTGVFLCLQAELRVMLEQEERDGERGAICITSSGAGRVAAPGQPHYTAAKHAILGLVRSVVTEYNRSGIRCNTILPGLVDTPLLGSGGSDIEALKKYAPGGRIGTPEEVAAAAVWLCSPAARWVNGQAIVVDGGGVMV